VDTSREWSAVGCCCVVGEASVEAASGDKDARGKDGVLDDDKVGVDDDEDGGERRSRRWCRDGCERLLR